MKGIVFSEFIDMVEEKFGPEIVDQIIEESHLKSEGAYTSVGTYDHVELLELVAHLSEETSIEVADLVQTFGNHLFGQFTRYYSHFFEGVPDSFAFLETIEEHVHMEVQKLYPDAELPTFATEIINHDTLIMTYNSSRPFAQLAYGLIQGCVEHFQENISIEMEDLSGGIGNQARFTLQRTP